MDNFYRIDLINAAMGAKRIGNDQLAEMSGVSRATVSSIRNGYSQITLSNLRKVADALEISWHELFTPIEGEQEQKAA